ncbi:hypothetical protein [Streptomyces californicus]|uniref:hypothetical protein n=1 Tax=Streptomyces californicus TaxID=67351 RepID=UPI0036C4B3C5
MSAIPPPSRATPPPYGSPGGWAVQRVPNRPIMRVIDVRRQETAFELPLVVTFDGEVRHTAALRMDVDEAIDLVDEVNLALDVRVREPLADACRRRREHPEP